MTDNLSVLVANHHHIRPLSGRLLQNLKQPFTVEEVVSFQLRQFATLTINGRCQFIHNAKIRFREQTTKYVNGNEFGISPLIVNILKTEISITELENIDLYDLYMLNICKYIKIQNEIAAHNEAMNNIKRRK